MVPGEAHRNAIGMERNSVVRTYAIHASSVVHVLCPTVASLFCCPTALHLSCLIQTLSHHTSYYPHARSPFSPRLITPVPPNTFSVHKMCLSFKRGHHARRWSSLLVPSLYVVLPSVSASLIWQPFAGASPPGFQYDPS